MTRLFSHFIPTTLIAIFAVEAVVLALCVPLGAHIRFFAEGGPHVQLIWPTVAFVAVMLAVMASFGLYSQDLPTGNFAMVVLLGATFLAGLCAISVVFYLLPDFSLGRGVFALAWLCALVLVMCARLAFLHFWSRLDGLARRILVLGTGPWASLLDGIERSPHGAQFCIVGFVTVQGSECCVPASRILSVEHTIPDMVRRYAIDEVVIAVNDRRGGRLPLMELLECKLRGVEVTELSSFYERERGQLQIDSMTTSWIVFGGGFHNNRPHEIVKAAFDITAAALLLLLALPVMLLSALAIILEDGFPVIYRQERVGLHGKMFDIIKFRSMRKDAESEGGPCWATPRDCRVTRVGRFLRMLRIDELPQAINVLQGDMSFVGPRPERPAFVKELEKRIPYYPVRHSVKPGITGWAQVRFPYSGTVEGAAEKLQYDLYYVKNRSLFLDIMIVIETIGVVLMGKGSR